MKKLFVFVLALVIAIGLLGCGNTKEDAVQTISVGQKVTVGEYSFVINEYDIRRFTSNERNFCVQSTVYNDSKRIMQQRDFGLSMELNYNDGYQKHMLWEQDWQLDSYLGSVDPQQSQAFWYAVDVPTVQIEDNSTSLILEIRFQEKDFKLVIR